MMHAKNRGELLAAIRKAAGISQDDLVDILHDHSGESDASPIDRKRISRLETGVTQHPNPEFVLHYLRACRIAQADALTPAQAHYLWSLFFGGRLALAQLAFLGFAETAPLVAEEHHPQSSHGTRDEHIAHYLTRLETEILHIIHRREWLVVLTGQEAASFSSIGLTGTHQFTQGSTETTLRDALETTDHLVLLGAPGAGKTTSLCSLALQAIDEYRAGRSTTVPLYIRLRNYRQPTERIEDFLYHELHKIVGDGSVLLHDFMWSLRVPGQWLVLLDGINEMAGRKSLSFARHFREEQHKRGFLATIAEKGTDERENQIAQLGREYQCKIVVSCRTHAYMLQPAWDSFLLNPLTFDQIREFVLRQKGYAGSARLLAAIKGDPRLENFAANPFYLHVLTAVYSGETRSVPKTRSDLLQELVVTLLRREFTDMPVTPHTFRRFAVIEKLAEVAYTSLRQHAIDHQFDLDSIARWVGDDALHHAVNLSLLVEDHADTAPSVGFYHQLIQEFLAGCHIAALFDAYETAKRAHTHRIFTTHHTIAARRRELQHCFGSVAMRQAVYFAAAMVTQPNHYLAEVLDGRANIANHIYSRHFRLALVAEVATELEGISESEKERWVAQARHVREHSLFYIWPRRAEAYLFGSLRAWWRIPGLRILCEGGLLWLTYRRNEKIASFSARCLGNLRGSEKAVKRLLHMAKTTTRETRWPIMMGIGMLESPRAFDYLLEQVIETQGGWHETIALACLHDTRATPVLKNLLNAPLSAGQHDIIAYALGVVGDETALEVLRQHAAYRTDDPRSASDAATSIHIAIKRIEARRDGLDDPFPTVTHTL